MKNEDQIQFMVDPFTGKVAVFIPAPIVVFDDVDEYQDFVNMMQGALEKFNKAIEEGHDEPDDVPIDKDYAQEVIATWQTILQQKLPTDDGPKK